MGSKKTKRKKLKIKKLEKFHKLKEIKRNKNVLCNTYKKIDDEKNLGGTNIIDNRSSPKKNYSSNISENDISNVKYFCKIRDDCFGRLQLVVSENCVFYDSVVTEEMLENLVLELEQYALLACLQVDIYQKSMLKIINDIKKSTEDKQVHKDVIKLLPFSVQEKTGQTKSTESNISLPKIETHNRIPKIASTKPSCNLESKGNFWREQFNYNSDSHYVIADSSQETNTENQNDTQNNFYGHTWDKEENYLLHDQSKYWINDISQTSETNFKNFQNMTTDQSSVLQSNISNSEKNNDIILRVPEQSEEKPEKVDPLLLSRNQLQKSVEQTLNESEKFKKQKQEEHERAYIAQILEGDDSLDEKFDDSLSDNENDSKENINEPNLIGRLKKMRELFGVEDEENKIDTSVKQKQSNKDEPLNIKSRRPTIWHYEKFIQLHKYSIIAAEMTFERRNINRKIFLELFGEDSDEENEIEYSSEEKHRLSCTERISSWVVKYLMPFYHKRRILGRKVFKSLGHYISSTIVDEIQYPDEWTVKYFVSKFFPPKKKYVCEADILDFQMD